MQTWCLWKAKKMAMVIVVKAFHCLYGQENANYCCDRVVIHEFCVNLYRLNIIKVMRRYSLILVLFLLMGLPNGVMADNDIHYYVSPTGSDRANGTKQAPWKTLSNAFGKLQSPLRQSKNTNFYLHLQNGENGINIDGGANHVVQGCLIEQLGMRGIAANGGDRASLTDAHFLIQNNIIRDVSHYRHTYQQSVFFSGCGITVSHNYLTGNQFAAITIHGGKDNVVENNIFANCPSAVKVFRFEGEYWLNRMAEQKTKDQLFKTVNIKSKAYQQAYPELKKDIMSKDIVNTVKDNLVVNCNVFLPNDYDKLIKKNNHQLFAFTPLKSLMNAENLKKYGLQPVYFEQVGVQKNIFD